MIKNDFAQKYFFLLRIGWHSGLGRVVTRSQQLDKDD